ncbi:MAG TPA: ABC transporter ATP-binding protein [Solirubrobacteraceae bacterium]|jgi:branched-chain amino acid transport system ATP-binding protein|nr:ABC transporter ATP-binding protein [Solirubrobacteraceae bacterium]
MSTSAASLLDVRDLTLRFGNVTAFENVSFNVRRGELFAVIGPNGAGKTSLFNALSRVYQPSAGSVRFDGRDLLALPVSRLAAAGIARTFQNLALFDQLTALENVLIGRHHLMHAGALRGGVWFGYARREERRHRAAAIEALEFAGVAEHAYTPVGMLPFGVRKQLEVARALAMEPKLMLLDEPVAGMSTTEREEITSLVCRVHSELGLTVLLVEHDMGMVMGIAQRVLVLDFGEMIALGTPAEVQRNERVIRAYLGQELEVAAGGLTRPPVLASPDGERRSA